MPTLQYELLNQERKMQETKKKVAAYCRVSTDNEDQANSFESQQRYFRQYIERNPDWELYAIFADEGISGTNTKKRKEFNRMIACAKNGDFDLIITKEISRFARNTLDSIFYTRDLKKHGVGVIFLNDNINTLDGDAELRLAIMSSIAQEESRKTSERVKWGQKRQMEQGVVFGRSMLGYDVKDGKMTINEDGAKIVRLIFRKFVDEGKGTHVIARELREEGISPMRVKEWSNTVILRVIRNEKYCGDLVQKKTYTPDFLSHEKKYNRGQEEFVILKDHHEPIISRELFDKANRILDAKSLSQEGKAKHSNRYPFSGKIKCGRCGASYVARYKTRKDGSQYKAWRCFEGAKHGSPHIDKAGNQVGCSGTSIRNEEAIHIMYLVCKQLTIDRQKIADNLIKTINKVISLDMTGADTNTLEDKIEAAQKKRTDLIDLYTSGDIDRDEFTALRAKYDAEIDSLKSMVESMEKQQVVIAKQKELMEDIKNAVDELIGGIEYEDEFYTQLLDKMVINDRENIDVYLNLLPLKWSYTVATASKKALASERNISEASLPISVSIALSSG
ncbi:recombinase family protein [Acutalibacter muris]|uniref:recombinase family protein n=1 Tax=Acutalibacter muris TaxID=1796620 RepID=UPI0020CE9306|nr:recombinase family protein [Acutalibacter muris]